MPPPFEESPRKQCTFFTLRSADLALGEPGAKRPDGPEGLDARRLREGQGNEESEGRERKREENILSVLIILSPSHRWRPKIGTTSAVQ